MRFLIPTAIAIIVILLSGVLDNDSKVRRYDCSISEISPDYPIEVKEACRRARMERINK
jgi:hypothetical protein